MRSWWSIVQAAHRAIVHRPRWWHHWWSCTCALLRYRWWDCVCQQWDCKRRRRSWWRLFLGHSWRRLPPKRLGYPMLRWPRWRTSARRWRFRQQETLGESRCPRVIAGLHWWAFCCRRHWERSPAWFVPGEEISESVHRCWMRLRDHAPWDDVNHWVAYLHRW